MELSCGIFFFFFQAEDGIRDLTVTGVQTCALPIFAVDLSVGGPDQTTLVLTATGVLTGAGTADQSVPEDKTAAVLAEFSTTMPGQKRSEERRVGKECRSRWAAEH